MKSYFDTVSSIGYYKKDEIGRGKAIFDQTCCFLTLQNGMMKPGCCSIRWMGALLAVMFIAGACGVLKPIEDPASREKGPFDRRGAVSVYLDFDDVLIPGDLKINRAKSYLFKMDNRPMGVLFLVGRNKPEVFQSFFQTNMAKDNWEPTGGFTGSRSLLLFEKENRQCIITMSNEPYGVGTQVEIWVTPKAEALGSGLLK